MTGPGTTEIPLNLDGDRLDLDDFLDWASHDLKTPLNMVIGFSRVVLRGMDGPVNETQRADLTSVHDNGQRLLSLITMLVDIARLNKGALRLSPAPVDIVQLLEATAAAWQIQHPGLSLTTEITLGGHPLRLDAARTRQLVMGSLTWAGSQVAQAGTVHLAATEDDHVVRISIESDGARDRTAPELDLAMLRFINRSLARLHGGDLTQEIRPEGGATVSFWLPK
jgi:signal transduction histidine kinase